MDAEPGYDTNKLLALRRELDQLNAVATKSGLIAPRKVSPEAALGGRKERTRTGSADQGKAAARRLLAAPGRIEGDVSPPISGTRFTGDGVVRLLAYLRKRTARAQRGNRFFRRLLTFLTRPVAVGMRTSAGISVERLQLISRHLLEIEAHGWYQFQVISAARRRKRQPLQLPKDVGASADYGAEHTMNIGSAQ
jgi:hypothetical protein